MGSSGSLHFFCTTHEVIEILVKEYSNPNSVLNEDPTHNRQGKPMIIISDCFTSVYDGSFAVYGDLFREAMLFSNLANMPVMGVTEANDEMVGLFVVLGEKIVTEALYFNGEWIDELDIALFIETMGMPYLYHEIESLLFFENIEDFIEKLHMLMHTQANISDVINSNVLQRCRLYQETEYVDVYFQISY